MSARNKANEVLMKIGQSTITDAEASLLPDIEDENAILHALADIINGRGAEGQGIKKLNAYALLEGIDLKAVKKVTSNIFMGAVIE